MTIERIDIHDMVVCDWCNTDYSESDQSGGFMFQNHATCPGCAEHMMNLIVENGEERYIQGHCPPELSFAAWVRQGRGPDPHIEIRTGEDFLT